jgi:uncharacterized protein (TIGR02246 family)
MDGKEEQMNRLLKVVVALVLGFPLMVQAAPPQAGAAGAQKADPAVVKVADAYLAAMKARDAAKIADLYTEDAIELPPYQKPVKGRAAIRNYYEQQFKGEPAEFSDLRLTRIEARTAGDIGYDVGSYSQKVTPKGGKPMEDTGNYTVILRRAEDGQWRVVYAIYNSHVQPTGAPASQQ